MQIKAIMLLLYLIVPEILFACPLCISNTGAEVRAVIFNHHFLFYLSVLLLPFIFFIVIACAIYYEPSKRQQPKPSNEHL